MVRVRVRVGALAMAEGFGLSTEHCFGQCPDALLTGAWRLQRTRPVQSVKDFSGSVLY